MEVKTTASVATLAIVASIGISGGAYAADQRPIYSAISRELGSIEAVSNYSGTDESLLYETVIFAEVPSGSSIMIMEPVGCTTNLGDNSFNCEGEVIEMTPFTLNGASGNQAEVSYTSASEEGGIRLMFQSYAENVTITAVAGQQSEEIVTSAESTIKNERTGLMLEDIKGRDVVDPYGDLSLNATFPGPVGIPSWHKYCPNSCTPKALHDYCTWSPDWHLKADFRGPCAYHDLGIDSLRKMSISLDAKRYQRGLIDNRFQRNLHTNCNYYNSYSFTARASCRGVANLYYEVVKSKTRTWDGR